MTDKPQAPWVSETANAEPSLAPERCTSQPGCYHQEGALKCNCKPVESSEFCKSLARKFFEDEPAESSESWPSAEFITKQSAIEARDRLAYEEVGKNFDFESDPGALEMFKGFRLGWDAAIKYMKEGK